MNKSESSKYISLIKIDNRFPHYSQHNRDGWDIAENYLGRRSWLERLRGNDSPIIGFQATSGQENQPLPLMQTSP